MFFYHVLRHFSVTLSLRSACSSASFTDNRFKDAIEDLNTESIYISHILCLVDSILFFFLLVFCTKIGRDCDEHEILLKFIRADFILTHLQMLTVGMLKLEIYPSFC